MIVTYAFYTVDHATGATILVTGKTKDMTRRMADYGTTNSNIKFQYIKEVPANELLNEEQKLQEYCKSKGLKYWGNSIEQFEVDNQELTDQYMLEYFGKEYEYNKHKNANYKISTLFGEEDIRDHRPNCWWNSRDKAMPITATGVNERVRKVKTLFKLNKTSRTIEQIPEVSVPTGQNAWNIIQVERKNQNLRVWDMLQKYHGRIPNDIMEEICTNLKIT
tara:strand:- start:1335 stop:1994 length:660 start_codon:yes stop_codon:yes gene_type:complete